MIRVIVMAGVMLLAAQTYSLHAASPSFSCTGVTQADLIAICGNEKLSKTDRMTTEMFESARRVDRATTLSVARAFLKDRANCGSDESCILVTQTMALAAFGQIAGDIAGAPTSLPEKSQFVRDGYLISRYRDGSGRVSIGNGYRDHGWSYDCRVDKMTDQRACSISSKIGGPFISYLSGRHPVTVCIMGHDFPGRRGMLRIDKNSPIETDHEGCVPSRQILEQMKSGRTLITRSYRWPRDWSVDEEMSLGGLQQVLDVVDEVLSGNVL